MQFHDSADAQRAITSLPASRGGQSRHHQCQPKNILALASFTPQPHPLPAAQFAHTRFYPAIFRWHFPFTLDKEFMLFVILTCQLQRANASRRVADAAAKSDRYAPSFALALCIIDVSWSNQREIQVFGLLKSIQKRSDVAVNSLSLAHWVTSNLSAMIGKIMCRFLVWQQNMDPSVCLYDLKNLLLLNWLNELMQNKYYIVLPRSNKQHRWC